MTLSSRSSSPPPPQKGRRQPARSSIKKQPKKKSGWIGWVIGGVLLVLATCVAATYWWLNRPLTLAAPSVDVQIEVGSSPASVARQISASGVQVNPELLFQWFKWSGKSKALKAGNYEFNQNEPLTPVRLLDKLVRGDQAMRVVTLVEGWNFRQVRAALAKAPDLKPQSAQWDEATLMQNLGRPGLSAEGRFFPDTYNYAKGSADTAVLARALKIMDQQLQKAWDGRASDVAVQSPEEALILASIVEKETGLAADRTHVSAVFNNRLRIGMRLQTDPTVIYGMGTAYTGSLRKVDLQTDTPYNTYTRNGLPPTPIAMPGKAALLAALHPASSRALYFVARGDGSSHFSESLDEHNRAVNQFIRGQ